MQGGVGDGRYVHMLILIYEALWTAPGKALQMMQDPHKDCLEVAPWVFYAYPFHE